MTKKKNKNEEALKMKSSIDLSEIWKAACKSSKYPKSLRLFGNQFSASHRECIEIQPQKFLTLTPISSHGTDGGWVQFMGIYKELSPEEYLELKMYHSEFFGNGILEAEDILKQEFSDTIR